MNGTTVPLSDIKRILWKHIQQFVEREAFPSVTRYVIGGADDNPPQLQLSLTKGDYFEPEKIFCEIQISHYPCQINGHSGTVSVIFSIPNVEGNDCTIDCRLVNVDFISDGFWDKVELQDIETFVANEWNA